ncbi:MFS transporter [Methanobrevibacter sp.]|uniref:MFS transporter n=1 Tax=Methanobrevibacter sp. TaxID=66852 RepID=UPI00388F5A1D
MKQNMTMVNKTVWSLSCVCFSLSTLLSLVGIISVIEIYYNVSIYYASLYASIFAGILGFSSLVLPAVFSRFEKKKMIIIILCITIICNLIEMFVSNYYVGVIFRIIPAFTYPIAVSAALTIVGEIKPNDTNKVVLGISSGSILGLSITTYLGLNHGFQMTMIWFVLINALSLLLVVLFIPEFEGNKEPVMIQISHAKSKLFVLSTLFVLLMIIGISITYNYIPLYLSQVTDINGDMLFVTLFLMGLISMFGTILYGYFLQKNTKISIIFYPIGFIIVMFALGTFVRFPFFEFLILMIFSIFDGSIDTVAQYAIISSLPEAPEFANGIYLLLINFSIFLGTMIGGAIIDIISILFIFIGSMISMLLALPFVLARVKFYPDKQ